MTESMKRNVTSEKVLTNLSGSASCPGSSVAGCDPGFPSVGSPGSAGILLGSALVTEKDDCHCFVL